MTKSRLADYVFFVGFCYNNSFDYFWAKRIVVFRQNQYFMKKRYCHIFLFALLLAFNVDVFATSSVGRVFDEWNISASVSPVNSDDRLVFIDPKNHVIVAQIEGTYDASGIINGHYYVNLGLSVKWATCNVGATKPEEYGGYYAWGETKEKDIYSWRTYRWCDGSNEMITKYCTNLNYGNIDNKTLLGLGDDVAHVRWGGSWRMPTRAEQDELRTKCTWSWTTRNGINGYLVTGPNGNSIFLPAAGYLDDKGVNYKGHSGFYWSASLHNSISYNAYYFYFLSGNLIWDNYYRCLGLSVRPVSN